MNNFDELFSWRTCISWRLILCRGRLSLFGLRLRPGSTATRNKNGGNDTKQSNCCSKYPGTFFQHISSLFYTHELSAETGNVSGQPATLWILYQYNQAK